MTHYVTPQHNRKLANAALYGRATFAAALDKTVPCHPASSEPVTAVLSCPACVSYAAMRGHLTRQDM